MGNFSKLPQNELSAALDRGYVGVRFQQGKPLLDRDLNLAADLASPRRLAASYLGNGVSSGNGFAISGLNMALNDFTISAGRCLVGGLEAALLADTTYRGQPVKTNVTPLPAGLSNVYLHVFMREVTGGEDALLLNSTDVKFETSVRDKADWEVLVSAAVINAPDHLLLSVINTAPLTVTDRRRVNLNLSAARDELDEARGTAGSLAGRLGASLAANGSLLANSVGNGQLAPQSVTQDKLAASAISIAQMKLSGTFAGSLTIAPGIESALTFASGRRPVDGPVLISIVISAGVGTVTWREFAASTPAPARGIRVRNENPVLGATLTVDIQAFEIALV